MTEAMISLLAPASVSPEAIDEWVDAQVYQLRARWRFTGVGIGEVRRSCPAVGGDWLIDLDLRARTVAPEKDVALAAIVIDLERRGLRPQLLVVSQPASRPQRPSRPQPAHRPQPAPRPLSPLRHGRRRPGCHTT